MTERTLKLHLKNFQSLSDVEVEFVQGTNIIMGESNSGKTAVLRGLEALLENTSGSTEFIKQGTDETEVTMQYEGHEVTWYRNPKEIKYKIDGQDYLKAGTTDLFKLLPQNGFVCDPQGDLANIESEWQLPYPYYKTPSELFKVFENIFCVSDSAKILKSMKESEDGYKKKVQHTEDEVDKIQQKIQAIKDLNVQENVQKLSVLRDKLQELLKEENLYKEVLLTLQELQDKLKKYKNLPISEDINLEDKLEMFVSLFNDFEKLSDLSHKFKILSELKGTRVTSQELFESAKEVSELNEDLQKLQKLEKVYNLELPTNKVNISEEKLQEISEYTRDLQKLSSLYKEGKRLQQEVTSKSEEVSRLQEVMKEVDICPLCGQSMKECKDLVKC